MEIQDHKLITKGKTHTRIQENVTQNARQKLLLENLDNAILKKKKVH